MVFGCAATGAWVAGRAPGPGLSLQSVRPYAAGRCERGPAGQGRADLFCMGSAGVSTILSTSASAAQVNAYFRHKLVTLELGPVVMQVEVENALDEGLLPPQYPVDFRVALVVRGLP